MKIHELIAEVIGPAEGRELELMLQGTKSNSVIPQSQWTKEWADAAAKKGWRIVKTVSPSNFGGNTLVIVSRWSRDADTIKKMLADMWAKGSADAAYHIKLGQLLGYSAQDIDHFLKNMGMTRPGVAAGAKAAAGSLARGAVGLAGRAVGAATGPAAMLGTYASDLNSGEERELARHRQRAEIAARNAAQKGPAH